MLDAMAHPLEGVFQSAEKHGCLVVQLALQGCQQLGGNLGGVRIAGAQGGDQRTLDFGRVVAQVVGCVDAGQRGWHRLARARVRTAATG